MAPNVRKIRRSSRNDRIIQQTKINMLNRFVSDSCRRGIERFSGGRISGVGGLIEEVVFGFGSNIGSDGEDGGESTSV